MKPTLRILSLGVLLAFLAGCESTSFSDRLEAVPPQTQVFEGTAEQVYFAAQKAFKRLDFVLVRTSMGRIEAASAIRTSKAFGDSRQTVARVKLSELEPGKTEVQLALTQETSSASMGGTRQEAVRQNAFFQTYFSMLQQVMQEHVTGAEGQKN
jgi:hypothetical protein